MNGCENMVFLFFSSKFAVEVVYSNAIQLLKKYKNDISRYPSMKKSLNQIFLKKRGHFFSLFLCIIINPKNKTQHSFFLYNACLIHYFFYFFLFFFYYFFIIFL